ncbi:MAG: hypothetical protein RMI91_13790 [Gemmatales bacterium]|nr:hypothetical protein [Gemmatales bacterium]MDW7995716.1 hypothetical protein [Gemmatales bacterium]
MAAGKKSRSRGAPRKNVRGTARPSAAVSSNVATPPGPDELSTNPRATAKARRGEQARQVLELRLAGFTYQEICQFLGLKSDWHVWNLLQRALKQFQREQPALLRQLDVARMDRLIRGLWRKAAQGDLPALDRLMKVLHQRERYVRAWTKESPTGPVPTLTLMHALAADRQLEAWFQQHRPPDGPALPLPPDSSTEAEKSS